MPRLPITLPQFGESAEATVVTWLVAQGDAIAAEQEVIEVQTEKSVMTVVAPVAGLLHEQTAKANQRVPVGGILGYLEVAADAVPSAPQPRSSPSATTSSAGVPAHSRHAFSATMAAPAEPGADYLSPRLRARLAEAGLSIADLAALTGTGANGRVTARDLESYLAGLEGETISPLRFAVASSMARSWSRPLATVARSVRMDALLEHRRTIAGRPSATVYCLRALALALRRDGTLACKLVGNRLIRPPSLDLAVAVEVGDGVLTPVIRRVDELDLVALTEAVHHATEQARRRGVTDQVGPSVATVSNYGTFGITWATPIPLPGQALILGAGALRNAPDWNPATKSWDRAREAELTLTFDHRIADGGAAARLLHHVAELLEAPTKMQVAG